MKAWSLLDRRTTYFETIPWRFAAANTQEGAKACVEQLEREHDSRLDCASRRWKATLLSHMKAVRDGGPVSPELATAVLIISDSPLDESAGEGYHREANCAHQRAPAATTVTIVQDVRFQPAIAHYRKVVAEFGKEGRNMVRFERRTWKRILQVSRRVLHRGKKMTETKAMRRVYRMDAMALDNWDIVVSGVPKPAEAEPDLEIEEDDLGAAQREYVHALLRVNNVFALEPRVRAHRHPAADLARASSSAAGAASSDGVAPPLSADAVAAADAAVDGAGVSDAIRPAQPDVACRDVVTCVGPVRDAPRRTSFSKSSRCTNPTRGQSLCRQLIPQQICHCMHVWRCRCSSSLRVLPLLRRSLSSLAQTQCG